MNPPGISDYSSSNPPGLTAETMRNGAVEIEQRERFSEGEAFSDILFDLPNRDSGGDPPT
jgi:hypothetical protein